MTQTVFEAAWANHPERFVYRNEDSRVGVLADAYPKFPDQVVLIPAKGFPERKRASLCDLDLCTRFSLTVLEDAMQRKMEEFSGVDDVRGIIRVDGCAVPNHPHRVMLPALRGESHHYTEPTRPQFVSDEVRQHLVRQTIANLRLSADEESELDRKLAKIMSEWADS